MELTGCDELCTIEFVGIPTVSQWGLLVLALALLVAAKVFAPAVVRAGSRG